MTTKTITKTCKAAQHKKDIVANIVKLGKQYPIIGILNMQNLPASSLCTMKKKLRGKVELVMTRKKLIIRALQNLKLENGEELISKIKGMPALMFTEDNPFALYKTIKKNKSPAPAKPGQEAPFDLIIPAGPTQFGPGPIISEFAQLGIPAGIENGKVAIKRETVAVEEGKTISEQMAGLLTKMGIEPMEIGLDLICAYEKGTIFGRNVLDVDEKAFMANLLGAVNGAHCLALEIAYLTKDTIAPLLTKAHKAARGVGLEAGITAPELVEALIARAHRQASSLKSEAKQ